MNFDWLAGMIETTYFDQAAIFLNIIFLAFVAVQLIKLRRNSKHAEKAIESVGSGYWVLDSCGQFLDVNDAYCRMVGYKRSQIMEMQITDFEEVATQDGIRKQIARILQKGQEKFETRHKKCNGEWVDLEITVTAVSKRQVIVYLRDISERKKATQEISHLALFDPLTSLPNRRLLHDRVEQALMHSARSQHHGALMFIDLDNFKTLNDTQGHAKGDDLLAKVADRLLSCVREGDTVARFGGDEFVVLLVRLSKDAAEAAAEAKLIGEKILTGLTLPFQLGELSYNTTGSMGVSLFLDKAFSIDDLLRQSDLAMYKSKASGRNGLQFFDPAMQLAVEARTTMEEELRSALYEQQFVLYYQPQANQDRRIIGAEALLRWHHPKRGMVQPGQFIALAEETGTILGIGQWALETACLQLVQWATDTSTADLLMSVNVSVKQIQHNDFVTQVIDTLLRTGANPAKLKLEVTESILVSNVEDVISKMTTLKQAGVTFSLDDFGTGYSSMTYLSRMPIDQLKIDRTFVANITCSANAMSICVAVLSLAHSLNLEVVAEGVETEEQFNLLCQLHHCRYIQGYLIGRPVAINEFETLLKISHQI